MKLGVFTRTDGATTRQTLAIFRSELFRERSSAVRILTMLPLGHLLRFVAIPLLISFVIQSLITQPSDISTPLWLIGGIALTMIIATVSNDKGYSELFKHEERVQTRLLEDGLRRLMNQSYRFFTEQKVGTLAGDLMNYARSYQSIMDSYFMHTNHLVVSFLVSLIVIGFIAPILLIPTILISTIMIGLNIRSLHARAPYRNKRKALTSKLAGSIADIMGNQQLVRVFASEERESRQILHERNEIESVANKEIDIVEREAMIRQTFLYTFQLITLLMFVWLSTKGLVSIAGMIFTFTYINRSTDAIFSISGIIRQFEQAFLDAAPIVRILNLPQTVTDHEKASKLNLTKSDIVLQDVNFAYSDHSDDPVFSKLNLIIPAGQRIGLAGHSGGGKTTLTKLLLRFADVDGGKILIDNQDIAKVTQSSLRLAIAYVPQDPFLFHRSLRDNIAYGRPGASDAEILAAAKKAHAMEFIAKLPNGLDTVVGERGVKLSGGQRQRIAIARAILKDAPILILDEATSALDSESEELIQASLGELMKGRTSVVIAHRLSTIAKLDRIIVLDQGDIIEDGTHSELIAKNGVYANLWKRQSGGFIDE